MATKQNTTNPNKQGARDASDDTSVQDNAPKATGHGGKVENDFNQVGEQKPRSAMRASARRTAATTGSRMWVGATSCSHGEVVGAIAGIDWARFAAGEALILRQAQDGRNSVRTVGG